MCNCREYRRLQRNWFEKLIGTTELHECGKCGQRVAIRNFKVLGITLTSGFKVTAN